jgi:hypothetical protein
VNLKYLSADKALIQSLNSSLAPDEMEIRSMLREMNQLDIELYEYAKLVMKTQVDALLPIVRSLANYNSKQGNVVVRTREFNSIATNINSQSAIEKYRSSKFTKAYLESFDDIRLCTKRPQCSPHITGEMFNVSGVIRPPFHKVPINVTYIEPSSYPPAKSPTIAPISYKIPPHILSLLYQDSHAKRPQKNDLHIDAVSNSILRKQHEEIVLQLLKDPQNQVVVV